MMILGSTQLMSLAPYQDKVNSDAHVMYDESTDHGAGM